jgi:hypothetical protein
MYEEHINGRPLPIGLFHPRWLLDGPPVVTRQNPWKMSRQRQAPITSETYVTSDRYVDSGEQLMVHTLHKAVEKLKSLPAGQKEAFASLFVKGTSNLTNRQDKLMASRSAIPTRLPDAIQKPTFLFARNRKRGLSGAALAERSERDRQRAIKRANCKAKATRREGEEIL